MAKRIVGTYLCENTIVEVSTVKGKQKKYNMIYYARKDAESKEVEREVTKERVQELLGTLENCSRGKGEE